MKNSRSRKWFVPAKVIILAGLLLLPEAPGLPGAVGVPEPQSGMQDDRVFDWLKNVYDQHEKKNYALLIEELESFHQTFPFSKYAPRVQAMLAEVYSEKRERPEAIASYLKLLFLYPDFEDLQVAKDRVRALVAKEKSFKKNADAVLALMNGSDGQSDADRRFALVEALYALNIRSLNDWLLRETRSWLTRFPDDDRGDKMLAMQAGMYLRAGREHTAAALLFKFESVFPLSPRLADVRFRRGKLLYKKLGKPEDAAEVFKMIVSEQPRSPVAPRALFLLAEVEERKLKQPDAAMVTYRNVVKQYPDSPFAVDALLQIAKIQTDNKKDYAGAIATYLEVAESYSDDERTIPALEKAAYLYERRFKDYVNAALQYVRIAEAFPTYKKAPDMLVKAGRLYENKADDLESALGCYDLVLKNYPEHKKAREAAGRIEKIQKKREKGR